MPLWQELAGVHLDHLAATREWRAQAAFRRESAGVSHAHKPDLAVILALEASGEAPDSGRSGR